MASISKFCLFILLISVLFSKLNIIDVHDSWKLYPSCSTPDVEYNIVVKLNTTNFTNDINTIVQSKLNYLKKLSKTILKSNDYK